MKKTIVWCDRCGREIKENEMHSLNATLSLDEAAETIARDLCPACIAEVQQNWRAIAAENTPDNGCDGIQSTPATEGETVCANDDAPPVPECVVTLDETLHRETCSGQQRLERADDKKYGAVRELIRSHFQKYSEISLVKFLVLCRNELKLNKTQVAVAADLHLADISGRKTIYPYVRRKLAQYYGIKIQGEGNDMD